MEDLKDRESYVYDGKDEVRGLEQERGLPETHRAVERGESSGVQGEEDVRQAAKGADL